MKCTKCKKDKPYAEFRSNKNFVNNNQRSYQCKACDLIKKQTPAGRLVIMYNSTRTASTTRGSTPPPYTIKELSTWAYENGYKKTYDRWVRSGYAKENVPSIDRINPSLPYTLNNIQIVAWSVNNSRNVTEMSRPVTRTNLNGKQPRLYTSVRAAARTISPTNTGGGILRAISSEKPAYGYLWH